MEIRIEDYQLNIQEWMKKYKNDLDWEYISTDAKLSENFIERWKDYVDWDYISIYQKIDEPFIEKYADKVNWEYIYQNIKY